MKHFLKTIGIVCSLLLTLSLLGCSSTHDSSKQIEKQGKPADSVASQDTKVKVTQADEISQKKVEENVTTVTKNATPSQQPNSNNTQQTSTSASKSNTSKASSNVPVTKPASTDSASNTTTKASQPTPKTQQPAATVTLSIKGPKDRGTIIAPASVSIKAGETIYDVLIQTAKKHNIVVDSNGSGSTTYIQGIDNIYEFDYGAKSGWVFKLNGASITKSVGAINVKDGDRIECNYTE